MIVGLGTDIVEIARIAQMIERHGESFLKRVYTETEVTFCQRRKHSAETFAGRWAAKEAVLKVLGTGFIRGIGFRDVEITSQPSGKPSVVLHGGADEHAKSLGIEEIHITISHCRTYATATAIGVSEIF